MSTAAKRIFLNIGIALLLFAVYSFANIIIGNSRLQVVEATVIESDEETLTGYPMVEFTVDGETYQSEANIAVDKDKYEVLAMRTGDTAAFYVNRYNHTVLTPFGYGIVFFFLIPAVILIILFREGFKGYITDFIAPNKPAFFIMTAVHVSETIIGAVHTHIEYSKEQGLGWLFLAGFYILTHLAVFIGWIVFNVIMAKKTPSQFCIGKISAEDVKE